MLQTIIVRAIGDRYQLIADELADALARALGRDVDVAVDSQGYRGVLEVRDPSDAAQLLRPVGATAPTF